MSEKSEQSSAVISNERVIAATPERIFEAFEQPDQLARWWGPKDFTNTFEQFEFKTGGQWKFVMHGPNGVDYANENIFREIQPYSRIVIEHVLDPLFTLTITLTPRGDKTHLAWDQEFENPEVAAKVRQICDPANEQNLDRMEAVLAEGNT